MNYKQKKQITISVGPLLFIFICLKLTNVITWSWWWVFSPLWLPFAIIFGVIVIGFIVTFLLAVFERKKGA